MRSSARHIALVALILLGATSCAGREGFLNDGAQEREPIHFEPLTEEERASIALTGPPSSAAQEIRGLVEARSIEGFGALEIDAPGLLVYWKGDIPDAAARLLEDLRARHGIEISVLPASYAEQEIRAEVHRLIGAYFEGSDLPLRGIGQVRDMSGIRVSVEPGSLELARASIRSAIPLEFVIEEGVYRDMYGRG